MYKSFCLFLSNNSKVVLNHGTEKSDFKTLACISIQYILDIFKIFVLTKHGTEKSALKTI